MIPTLASPAQGQSRAVLHAVRPGSTALCSACGQAVKFAARVRRHQVIANVYVDGHWDRVEHYHPDCYEQVSEPHGVPTVTDSRARQ